MLSPYRVLDLTDEKGILCGKLLGDLGADVIKIERPGGDAARNVGPFYHDEPDPEKSLFWFAFNTSKRGITLDIETDDGQEIFKRLVKTADFVIESFTPGYLDKLGLGYTALEKVKPEIIMVSITPFGQTGPYKDYKSADIVIWAMGGYMYTHGDLEHPPVQISHHSHAYLHASVEATSGALMALHYRDVTGEGQQVDVSIQGTMAQCCYMITSTWDMMKVIQQRGELRRNTNVKTKTMWPCKDGYIHCSLGGGLYGMTFNPPIIEWMASEGMADDWLRNFDWEHYDLETATQEEVDKVEEQPAEFFLSHTKAELLEGAVKHKVLVCPAATTKDTLESPQLAARGFWAELEHPELGTSIAYPGPFAQFSETPVEITRRAPLIGEHNQDVYQELGLSAEEILTLKQAKVI
jgi:crotonobetainyl-CoA:carnitine CoA-transferase CaiB-like acyl-CoA transferase